MGTSRRIENTTKQGHGDIYFLILHWDGLVTVRAEKDKCGLGQEDNTDYRGRSSVATMYYVTPFRGRLGCCTSEDTMAGGLSKKADAKA